MCNYFENSVKSSFFCICSAERNQLASLIIYGRMRNFLNFGVAVILTNFLLLALLPFCSGKRNPLCNTVRNEEHLRENVLNLGQHLRRCYFKSRPTMYSPSEYGCPVLMHYTRILRLLYWLPTVLCH